MKLTNSEIIFLKTLMEKERHSNARLIADLRLTGAFFSCIAGLENTQNEVENLLIKIEKEITK